MSYILDALRKSERERQAGQVPGLPTLASGQDKKHSHWIVWLAAILLLINLGGAAYWLFLMPAHERTGLVTVDGASRAAPIAPPAVIAPENTASLPAAAKADQAETAPIGNQGLPAQAQPAVTPGAASVMATLPAQPQPVPQAAQEALPPVASPLPVPAPATQPKASNEQTTPASSAPAPAKLAITGELPYFPPENLPQSGRTAVRGSPVPEDDFDEVDAEMEAEGERLADARTDGHPDQGAGVQHGVRAGAPHLSELPPGFQERVPPFKITMFAYSKNPAERFVIIDMKKSRVGDKLAGGILLIEIQPENLVLELDGQKFMIPRY